MEETASQEKITKKQASTTQGSEDNQPFFSLYIAKNPTAMPIKVPAAVISKSLPTPIPKNINPTKTKPAFGFLRLIFLTDFCVFLLFTCLDLKLDVFNIQVIKPTSQIEYGVFDGRLHPMPDDNPPAIPTQSDRVKLIITRQVAVNARPGRSDEFLDRIRIWTVKHP